MANIMTLVAGNIEPTTGIFIPCVAPVEVPMELFDSILFNSHAISFRVTQRAVITHGARRLANGTWKATRFKSGPYTLLKDDTLHIARGQFMLDLN